MSEIKKELDQLKARYGFSMTDEKWVSGAGELLEYIDVELIAVEFNRKDCTAPWESEVKRAIIKELSDYDPILGVYKCKYRFIDTDKPTEWRETTIIPEGFSLLTDTSTWMIRFVPFSLHCKMSEASAFNKKLSAVWTHKSIAADELMDINNNEEALKLLQAKNIGVIVKTEDSEYLWIRVNKINFHHDFKNTYTLRFRATDGKVYSVKFKSDHEENEFIYESKTIGRYKIIDLGRLE